MSLPHLVDPNFSHDSQTFPLEYFRFSEVTSYPCNSSELTSEFASPCRSPISLMIARLSLWNLSASAKSPLFLAISPRLFNEFASPCRSPISLMIARLSLWNLSASARSPLVSAISPRLFNELPHHVGYNFSLDSHTFPLESFCFSEVASCICNKSEVAQ